MVTTFFKWLFGDGKDEPIEKPIVIDANPIIEYEKINYGDFGEHKPKIVRLEPNPVEELAIFIFDEMHDEINKHITFIKKERPTDLKAKFYQTITDVHLIVNIYGDISLVFKGVTFFIATAHWYSSILENNYDYGFVKDNNGLTPEFLFDLPINETILCDIKNDLEIDRLKMLENEANKIDNAKLILLTYVPSGPCKPKTDD